MKRVSVSKHDQLYRVAMFLFIVSLGLGDRIAIFGVRVTYIATAVILIISMSKNRISFSALRNRKYSRMLKFGILWLMYPFLTIMFARNLSLWISQYIALMINFLVIWLIVRYIKTGEDWLLIGRSAAALLCITLSVGLWEIYTSDHIYVPDYTSVGPVDAAMMAIQPVTFYGNINDSASALFLLFFTTSIYVLYINKWRKYGLFYVGVGLLTVYEVWVSQARAVMYSFVVLLVFFVGFAILAVIKKSQAKVLYYISAFCVAAGISIAFLLHPPSYYIGLLAGRNGYVASGNYSSDLFRLRIIKESFVEFVNTFFIGLGPGQSIVVSGINLHNFYLEILFEYGIWIGGFFLYKFFCLSFPGRQLEPRKLDSLMKSTPFVFLLLGISSSHFFSIRLTWVCIAFVFCLKYGGFYADVRLNQSGEGR